MSDNTAASAVIDPKMDGVDHINVYSGGQTELGRLLSNFAHTPFTHPDHGSFASMEAYWYWCGSGRTANHLRRLYGSSAKSAGVKCDPVPMPDEEFRVMIVRGFRCKITQNAKLLELFINSSLPFVHYFVYGGKHVVLQAKHEWQMQALEALRREYKSAWARKHGLHTKEQLLTDGYELADFLHHGSEPTAEQYLQYAQNLGWTVEEIKALPIGNNAWAVVRKAKDLMGLNRDEVQAVVQAMIEDDAAEAEAAAKRAAEAKALSQALPTDEPRPSTPEEAGVVEDPYEIKWDN